MIFSPVFEEEINAAVEILRTAPLTTLFGGYAIDEFEKMFAEKFGSPYAVVVTSGTAALHAALMAAGIGSGDEVLVTPFSFVASVSVVIQVGATPVFIDIDPETYNMDVNKLKEKITSRTKAVLPVHICGYPVDMRILKL